MPWTEITREQYRRDGLRYASDTTDAEWKLIEPLMPAPCRRGRPREISLRVIMNAILYIAATGCQWRALPKDFPPCSTVQYYFYKWRGSGLWRTINDGLVRRMRERQGRVYRGPMLLQAIADLGKWTIEIVTRSQSVGTFKAEPRRWVVERTLAWFGRNRRLAKDFEASIASAEAWVLIASIRLLSHRLARA
jgi:transposase